MLQQVSAQADHSVSDGVDTFSLLLGRELARRTTVQGVVHAAGQCLSKSQRMACDA